MLKSIFPPLLYKSLFCSVTSWASSRRPKCCKRRVGEVHKAAGTPWCTFPVLCPLWEVLHVAGFGVVPFRSATDAACRGGLIHFLSPLLILVKLRTAFIWPGMLRQGILMCQCSPCYHGLLKLALSIFP